jgi:membrane-associated protease RseP (regulator of RpoE activity)
MVLEGKLLREADEAYTLLAGRLERYGYTPHLRRRGGKDHIYILPLPPRPRLGRPWVNLVLFLATVVTTIFAGAVQEGVNPLQNPAQLARGIPFSFALLTILGVHELSHYTVSRWRGIAVTLPYFIPSPLPFLGTFGAFIQMRSAVRDRRALFDMGLAGPMAGLAMSILFLALGLSRSEIIPYVMEEEGMGLGTSLLMEGIARLVLRQSTQDVTVMLHPLALAGWFGFFVTAMNFMPIGQLDGGHMAYALFGERFRVVARIAMVVLVGMGLLFWQGWLFWAFLSFVMGMDHPLPQDAITDLDPPRKALGILALVLLALIITPQPFILL